MSKNWRDISRSDFSSENATIDNINAGCLQRIANSVEAVAHNYEALLSQVQMYKKLYAESQETIKALSKTNTSLRGWVNRNKKKASINPNTPAAE